MASLNARIPYSRIKRIAPVIAQAGEGIVAVAQRTGADYVINGGTYNLTTRALDSGLKIDGRYEHARATHGLGIRADGKTLEWSWAGVYPPSWMGYYRVGAKGGEVYGKHLTDYRQRTGIGYDADGIYLAATTTGMTTADFAAKYFADAESWINLDGGASTQWVSPDGRYTTSRKVVWYIAVWLNKDDNEDGGTREMMTNLPLNGEIEIMAAFGEVNAKLWKDGHKGIDMVSADKTVYSPCDGVVRVVAYDAAGWGQYVSIGDVAGRRHLLCHMVKGSVLVKTGDKVTRTTKVGTMGSSGNSTGAHLHYQLNTSDGTPIDPSVWTHIPNKRGKYKASDYAVDKDGKLIDAAPPSTGTTATAHWAEQHYNNLVARGVIDGGDTSSKWRDYDAQLSSLTVGQLLALVDKATR